MIGAAIVAYPYGFFIVGFPFGVIFNFLVGIMTIKACDLYFKIKDLTGNLKSYPEIGFKLQGRKSIFIINMILFTNTGGCLILFYNLFSDSVASLYRNLFNDYTSIFSKPNFHLFWYAFLNATIIFKRTIKELNIIGTIHYFAAKLLLGTLILKFLIFTNE